MMGRTKRHENDPDAPRDSAGTEADTGAEAEREDAADAAQAELEELRRQLEETEGRWKMAVADFRNYQRRAVESEAEARRQATSGVVRSLLPILDNFDMALEQGASAQSIDQVLGGVRSIREELVRSLESFGVSLIRPDIGEEPDPMRHEVLSRQPVEGVEPGRICAVYQPGYLMGERVIRPAKVAIADTPA